MHTGHVSNQEQQEQQEQPEQGKQRIVAMIPAELDYRLDVQAAIHRMSKVAVITAALERQVAEMEATRA